ncbi:unnamed protein product [Urochloa decumbens]|uniref:Myb/SANT-like domain-containing protein n=1 Tax=Urochloa decumbens TaxID=240449 RepID=A0ABC9GWN2_9POAL
MSNLLRRPAPTARREDTPGSEIDGSGEGEVHGGVGGGSGSTSAPEGSHLPGGPAAVVHGAARAAAAQLGSYMGPTTFPAAWAGAPSSAASAATNPGWAATAGGAAMAGCPPDWWNNAATLGPDWLATVLAAATAPAMTSTGLQRPDVGEARMEVPVRGGPSRRRGGRGGRAPRPPAPVRAAQAAPASIDLTDSVEADWCDENTRIVSELFADEVQKGNRSTTHLNKAGYLNVIKIFEERTGLVYTRKQFKNKWDKLKNDHSIWKELLKETGLGWDESGKNIVMTDSWWKITAQKIKGCTRFKHRGLQNDAELGIMFEDIRNTGDDHWCASSGVAPSQEQSAIPIDDDDEAIDEEQDSEQEEVTPTSGRGKRGRGRGAENSKGKKPKTSTGHWFQKQMGKLVEMNERTSASCESIARREDKSGSSIKDVMALVKECGAVPGTNEHFIATLVFTNREEREMFLTLDSHQERFEWLTRKHEYNMMCLTRNH